MTQDLRARIRNFAEQFEATLPVVTPRESATPSEEVRQSPGPGRSWQVAVAAAVVALVVIGGVLILLRSDAGDPDVATTVPDSVVTTVPIEPTTLPPTTSLAVTTTPPSAAPPVTIAPGERSFVATYRITGEIGPEGASRVYELSYLDEQTWHLELVAGNEARAIGSFQLAAGGVLYRYDAFFGDWETVPYTPDRIEDVVFNFLLPFDPVDAEGREVLGPGDGMTDVNCEQTGTDTIHGRDAAVFRCTRSVEGLTHVRETWVDSDTGLLLRLRDEDLPDDAAPRAVDVLEISFDPGFPVGLFEFEPPTDSCGLTDRLDGVRLSRGCEAPGWTLPTIDGTELRFEDLLGKPTAVFVWVVCPDPCGWGPDGGVGNLPDLQALFDRLAPDVNFVAVAYDSDPSEVADVVSGVNLTVPVAIDAVDVGGLEWAWNLNDRPLWILLDAEGHAVLSLPFSATPLEVEEAILGLGFAG